MDEGAVPCSSKRTHEQDLTVIKLLTTVDSPLAKGLNGQEVTDKDINPVLANDVTDMFRKGTGKEQFATMLKDEKNSEL